MHRLWLLLVLSLLPSQPGYAECACLWRGSFSEVQAKTDLVVSAEVVATKGNSIDLQVNRVLRGKDTAPRVRVWLHAADYCRPPAKRFPIGSQWVMALHKIRTTVPGGFNPGTPNISYGRPGDYSLSNCGGYWLSQMGNRVSGNLIDAPRWAHEPKMAPVLLDLVADFVAGKIDRNTLLEASQENPALDKLILDTRSFLRNEN